MTTIGDAKVVVGAVVMAAVIGSDVDAGVDETATLESAMLDCGSGATATDAIVFAVELMVEACVMRVEDVVASAGGATDTGATVVDCTWGGSSTCASETEVDKDSNKVEEEEYEAEDELDEVDEMVDELVLVLVLVAA